MADTTVSTHAPRASRNGVRKAAAAIAAVGFLGVTALAPLSLAGAFAVNDSSSTEHDAQSLTVVSHIERAIPLEVSAAEEAPSEGSAPSGAELSLNDFLFRGVVNWGGYKFTYYSQQVLPGGGLDIPGRHVNAAGYVSDSDGYIVLAGSAPKGTIYETPFGYQGKIYDRGTTGNHLDVYIR